jgi:hypothetical protein
MSLDCRGFGKLVMFLQGLAQGLNTVFNHFFFVHVWVLSVRNRAWLIVDCDARLQQLNKIHALTLMLKYCTFPFA